MKKKIIIIAVIAVLVIVSLLVYFAVSDLMQEVILREEIDTIGNSDITEDNIDMTIKTKGDYAVIEQTIKEYMNTYSVYCKELANILEDEQMAKILTADNYKNDGPEFTNSKEYITKTRIDFNEKINLLINMTNEETMKSAILDKNLNEDMIKLYNELMLGDEIKVDLQETIDALQESNVTVNNILDVQENVINMLIENEGKWQINNDDEIEFESQKLVDQYNEYINSL